MLDKTEEIHRQMLVGGEWVDSASGETIAVENPGNRTVLGYVPRGDVEDVERAVRAAESAFASWSRTEAPAFPPAQSSSSRTDWRRWRTSPTV